VGQDIFRKEGMVVRVEVLDMARKLFSDRILESLEDMPDRLVALFEISKYINVHRPVLFGLVVRYSLDNLLN
jgi:hypothetical protein